MVGMETDKQLYRVFGAEPQWVYLLARLPPVGKCAMRSLTVKRLERRADGVIVPEALTRPLPVIEFQFDENPLIYTRTVQKMAAVQEEFAMREVQGIIFFGDPRLDPQTKPWTSIVRSIVLPDEVRRLAERSPEHALVAVFQPLLAESASELEQKAGVFFRTIKNSKLKKDVKQALEEVFVSWLLQRLPNRTKQEIEKMLIGELPELRETRAGQDLIQIGKEEGLAEGRAEGLVESVGIVLEGKRGRLTKALRQRIRRLGSEHLRQLLADALAWESLDPLEAWLAKRGQ
jgi:predicted transposase YdaD